MASTSYMVIVSSCGVPDRPYSTVHHHTGERLAHGRKRVLHHGDEIELGATSKHSGIGATHGGVKLVYHKTELRTDEVRVRTRHASPACRSSRLIVPLLTLCPSLQCPVFDFCELSLCLPRSAAF